MLAYISDNIASKVSVKKLDVSSTDHIPIITELLGETSLITPITHIITPGNEMKMEEQLLLEKVSQETLPSCVIRLLQISKKQIHFQLQRNS